jgi:hypothetical protein
MLLVRVVAPRFVAGLELDDQDRCVRAAPILRWTLGWRREDLRDVFDQKGWRASIVCEFSRDK